MTAKPQKATIWTRGRVLGVRLSTLTTEEIDTIPAVITYVGTKAFIYHPVPHCEALRLTVWRLSQLGFTCIEKNS